MSDLRINMMRRTFSKNHTEAVNIVKDITSEIINDVVQLIGDRLVTSPIGRSDTAGESESDEFLGDFVTETLAKLSSEMIAADIPVPYQEPAERPATPEIFHDESDDDNNDDFVDDLVQVTLTKVSHEIINSSIFSPADDNISTIAPQTDRGTVNEQITEATTENTGKKSFFKRILGMFQKKSRTKEENNGKQKNSFKEAFRNMTTTCFRRKNRVHPSTTGD